MGVPGLVGELSPPPLLLSQETRNPSQHMSIIAPNQTAARFLRGTLRAHAPRMAIAARAGQRRFSGRLAEPANIPDLEAEGAVVVIVRVLVAPPLPGVQLVVENEDVHLDGRPEHESETVSLKAQYSEPTVSW